jgi:hypothetical protein
MKALLPSAVVAAIVSLVVCWGLGGLSRSAAPAGEAESLPAPAAEITLPVFSISEALVEDTWVNAARTAGSDLRTLTDASNSVCYLTRVEISGVQGPEDSNACAIEIDDFTGFWQLSATVKEGGRSEVRCNARCLTFDPGGTE